MSFFFPRRFGEDRIREILHKFGPRKKRRMADERPFSEWREEGKRRQAKADANAEDNVPPKDHPESGN